MYTPTFWTATALSIAGNTLFTSSALFSNKKIIVGMQTSNHFLSSVAQYLLSAFSGMAQDVICFFKNLILLFIPESCNKIKFLLNVFFIAAGIAAGVTLNVLLSGNVWYGYLPVFSTAVLSSTLLLAYLLKEKPFKQLLLIKGGMMFNAVCWSVYGIYVELYPVTAFNCLTFALAIGAIVRFLVADKKRKNEALPENKEETEKTEA